MRGNRGLWAVLFLTGLALAAASPAGAQQATELRFIGPQVAPVGESFTGRVVEATPQGLKPVPEGSEVVFRGEVIPVSEGGVVRIPAFAREAGNWFVALSLLDNGGHPASVAPHHVEVVKAQPTVTCKVAQTSPVLTPGGPFRVTGQGLGGLAHPALTASDGSRVALGPSVGSSLQRIYTLPSDLPKGIYRFEALDASGNRVEAPGTCSNPVLQMSGPAIKKRGQRGAFTIRSDTDGTLLLSGGEPTVSVDERVVPVKAGVPVKIGFTALAVGDYTVFTRFVSPDEAPAAPNSSEAHAQVGPVQTTYDPAAGETQLSAPVQATTDGGGPLAGTPVDVVLTHPNGASYARAVTDGSGKGRVLASLPGKVAASMVAAQVFRVVGHPWKPAGEKVEGLCPKGTVPEKVDYPQFSWSGPAESGASYTLRVWEPVKGLSPSALMLTEPYYERSNLAETTFDYPADAPPLLPGCTYAWSVDAFVGSSAAASVPVFFDVAKLSPEQEVNELLKRLEELRKQLDAAKGDVEDNPLVQEVRLIQAAARILGGLDGVGESTLTALKDFLSCNNGPMSKLPKESFDKGLLLLEGLVKLAMMSGDLSASQRRTLETFLARIEEVREKGVEKLAELKERIDQFWDPIGYLKGLVEDGISEALHKLAEKALAKLVGAKAAGAWLSMAKDLLDFADALKKISTLEDLRKAWNLLMLEIIAKGSETKLRIDPGWTSLSNLVWLVCAEYKGTVILTPHLFCWQPKEGGAKGEGTWCEEGVTFAGGSTSMEVDVSKMKTQEVGEPPCKTKICTQEFTLSLPAKRKCPGPCYVVMHVKATTAGGGSKDIDFPLGVIP